MTDDASPAAKAIFAAGMGVVAIGSALGRRRGDDDPALDDGQEVRHA